MLLVCGFRESLSETVLLVRRDDATVREGLLTKDVLEPFSMVGCLCLLLFQFLYFVQNTHPLILLC